MTDDKIISLEPNSTYQFETHSAHSPDTCHSLGCENCAAMDRLFALADVFDEGGNYLAGDCCRDWGELASRQDPFGRRMAAAIIRGVRPDESTG